MRFGEVCRRCAVFCQHEESKIAAAFIHMSRLMKKVKKERGGNSFVGKEGSLSCDVCGRIFLYEAEAGGGWQGRMARQSLLQPQVRLRSITCHTTECMSSTHTGFSRYMLPHTGFFEATSVCCCCRPVGVDGRLVVFASAVTLNLRVSFTRKPKSRALHFGSDALRMCLPCLLVLQHSQNAKRCLPALIPVWFEDPHMEIIQVMTGFGVAGSPSLPQNTFFLQT